MYIESTGGGGGLGVGGNKGLSVIISGIVIMSATIVVDMCCVNISVTVSVAGIPVVLFVGATVIGISVDGIVLPSFGIWVVGEIVPFSVSFTALAVVSMSISL